MKTQRDDLQDRFLDISFAAELEHGIVVSNLAYDVAKELGLSEDFCYQLAIAGMVHDIGKFKLVRYIEGAEDLMAIEELRYVRMHSNLGYLVLKDQGIRSLCWRVSYITMRITTEADVLLICGERKFLWEQGF